MDWNKSKRMMTTAVLAAVFVMLANFNAKAFQANGKKPYRSKTFTIHTPGKLKVRTSGGYIKVVGSKGNRVRVKMFVTKNGKNLTPNDTKLENFNIQIEKEGNTIIASAKPENSSWWKFWEHSDISISFVVHVPHKMDTGLRTSGGHIIANGLTGTQRIKTSGGYLQLKNLYGTVSAKTSGGRIMLSNSSGDIRVKTSGGRINISNVTGQLAALTSGGRISAQNARGKLRLHTSGGNIKLVNVAGSIKASTSGGSIIADLTSIKHSVELRTSGGNIKITIPQNVGVNLNLSGSSVQTKLHNFSGTVKYDRVKGEINGGGPEISAHTSGGTVSISYK